MLAHHDGLHVGLGLGNRLHGEAELEAGAHPGHVGHLAAENLLSEALAVGRGRDGDDRVRVHVIDELARQEAVQRRVDRGGAGIQVKGRVGLHRDHRVLGLGLQALVGAGVVNALEGEKFFLVEGGEKLAAGGAQIAARTLHPEDLDVLARDRVLAGELGGRVAAPGVGDALVAAENVGAIDETADGIEGRGFGIVPREVNVAVGRHGLERE